LDSEILAEVYLELIGGRQPDLVLSGSNPHSKDNGSAGEWRARPRDKALPSRITPEEAAAHASFVDGLGADALWKKLG